MEEQPRQWREFPAEDEYDRYPQDPQPPHGRHGHGGYSRGHGAGARHGGARLTVYFLTAILCNFLLAVYALYAVGVCAQLAQDTLSIAQGATLAETVFQIVLLISPFLLTILLNRLLFCAMRGRRRRFPRWVAPTACLIILAVQAATIYLILSVFGTQATGGFSVDTISALMP